MYFHTCAVGTFYMIAADCAAIHNENSVTTSLTDPYALSVHTGRMSERAGVIFTVTQYELCFIIDSDNRVQKGIPIFVACNAESVKTEIKRIPASDFQLVISRRVACEIDIGSIAVAVINSGGSVPCGPYHISTFACVVAYVCMRFAANWVRMRTVVCRRGYARHAQRGAQKQHCHQ